jgi:hypothetical protein
MKSEEFDRAFDDGEDVWSAAFRQREASATRRRPTWRVTVAEIQDAKVKLPLRTALGVVLAAAMTSGRGARLFW